MASDRDTPQRWADLDRIRVLATEHYSVTMHVYDNPARRGTNCRSCDALAGLRAPLDADIENAGALDRQKLADAMNAYEREANESFLVETNPGTHRADCAHVVLIEAEYNGRHPWGAASPSPLRATTEPRLEPTIEAEARATDRGEGPAVER